MTYQDARSDSFTERESTEHESTEREADPGQQIAGEPGTDFADPDREPVLLPVDGVSAGADTDTDTDVATALGTPKESTEPELADDELVGGEVTDLDGSSAEHPAPVADPVSEPSLASDSSTDAGSGPLSPVDGSAPVAPVAGTTTAAGTSTTTDSDWRELQGRFVDDPAEAVREAGDRVEKALSELRNRIDTGSTEDLRIAFRRLRDLHSTLT